MWPFIKQKRQDAKYPNVNFVGTKPEPPRRVLTLEQLVDGIGDCSDLADNDVALKFWLPEPAMQGLKQLSDIYDRTCSGYIRDFLLIHCYGIYTFEWLREQDSRHIGEIPLFSRKAEKLPPGKIRVTTYFVPELGKSTASMKIWIPARLKNDLIILAKHVDLTVSNYVREIVISRLLGHGTLPMRPKMLSFTPDPVAEDWNEDRDVPWREVSEEEHYKHEVFKVETEVVDQTE